MWIRKLALASLAVMALAASAGVVVRDEEALLAKKAGPGSGPGAAEPAPGPMAMPVPFAPVVRKTIPIYLDYSARTEAMRTIALRPKVSGFVGAQFFAEGADVKAGDLLYKLDDRDYRAALDQARALVARDEAALDYAKANAERSSMLVRSGAVTQDAVEQRSSAQRQAEAAVSVEAAAARTAEINLGYTEIRAPFAGRIGRDQAPVGTLIMAGDATLNTLVQLDPIYVAFNPSETDLVEIQKARASGRIDAEVRLPGAADGAPQKGQLTFLDNAVDRATGTITARATIGNPGSTLLPGQYVRIRLLVRLQPDAMMVPLAALGSSQLGKFVYVIGKDDKAEQKLVTLGPADGDLVAVNGVAEGDRIITGNLQKIGPGALVKPLSPVVAAN